MNSVSSNLSLLLRNPWAVAISTALGLGAAVITGALVELDLALLPLIDKPDLLGTLLAQVSLWAVVVRFGLYLWNIGASGFESAGVSSSLPMRRLTKGAAGVWEAPPTRLVIAVAFLSFASFALTKILGIESGFSDILLTASMGVAMVLFVKRFGLTHVLPSVYGLLILIAAMNFGRFWIEELRNNPHSVLIHLRDERQPTKASIVMQGRDGLVVFTEGMNEASYISWHEISRVDATPPSVSQR